MMPGRAVGATCLSCSLGAALTALACSRTGLGVLEDPGLGLPGDAAIGFACVDGYGSFNITALEMTQGYVEHFTVGFVRYCTDTDDVPTVTGCLNLEHVPNSYQGGLWDGG